jgi:hypothetical protein
MQIPGQGPEGTRELRVRSTRYNDAGLIRKAAMRLAGEALSSGDRELLRRRDIGVSFPRMPLNVSK